MPPIYETPAWLARQSALIGDNACALLAQKTVMLIGLGGVGGHALEALTRTGIQRLIVIDNDTVSETNRNRQLLATVETIGQYKTDAAKTRVHQIAPEIEVISLAVRITPETIPALLETYRPHAIVDAIDDVKAKEALAVAAQAKHIYLVSAMGTGNKLHPERLMLGDISKTAYCPLAKAVRTALRREGVLHLPVVWSDEPPAKIGSPVPASVSFVPGAAGMLLASAVINHFLAE